jgi:NitT/TauT family transport system substrate-binding protein
MRIARPFHPLFLLAGLLPLLWIIGGCQAESAGPEAPIPVRFATVPFIGETTSYVAYANGYFADEGLDVTLSFNPGGWMSLRDLFQGDVDIATVAELPIVYSAFDKQAYTDFDRGDFYIIGDLIFADDFQQVVARRDRGITSPADLKGKTLGVFAGTTLDFYMDMFLIDNNISQDEVTVVNLDVFQLTDALVAGEVDAIFTWQPHVDLAMEALGENGIAMSSRLRFTTAWLITVMKEYGDANPEVLRKFLRAMLRAEQFIQENPEAAVAIHAELTDVPIETVAKLQKKVAFDLSLSEGLLIQLQEEARWLIRSGRTTQTEVPDFMEFINLDPLRDVKPGGISIIQ